VSSEGADSQAAAHRPRLVIVYDRHSLTPLELAEAARPICDLIWVLDLADPLLGPLQPLIRRLGTVVDTTGLREADILERVGLTPPDGVITFAERQLPLAAAIAAAFGLRFHSPATALLMSNKHDQRAALADAGVPGPAFWPLAGDADMAARERLADALRYPVVLKPQRGNASRNTSLVHDRAELLRMVEDPDGGPVDMLVEELLVEAHPREQQRFGDTFMVDSVVEDGRASHYALTRHFIPAPPFRGAGTFIPSDLEEPGAAQLIAATAAALAALGVDNGFTNTDLILTPDGPRVLEVNGRIGGEIHTLIELAGGSPLLREAMRFALGAPASEVAQLPLDGVGFAINYHAPATARRLLALDGLDAVAALAGVTRVVSHRQVGDTLDWREGTMSRIFTAYGVTSDHDQLSELHAQIYRSVAAGYDDVLNPSLS